MSVNKQNMRVLNKQQDFCKAPSKAACFLHYSYNNDDN